MASFTAGSMKGANGGGCKVLSSPICPICLEDLLAFVDINENNDRCVQLELKPIVATICGHLFHTGCLNLWFKENRQKPLKNCPVCRRQMMANDTKRLFPVFERNKWRRSPGT